MFTRSIFPTPYNKMTLLNDILEWTTTLPDWQRDATRRLLQNEDNLSEADYEELFLLLKKEHGINKSEVVEASPLLAEHLPADRAPGETVVLLALRNLENVNRIPNNQSLVFSKTGMTVIYGDNGSGKSGYARVLKRACRARDQSEPVHPNANDPTSSEKVPSAKFDIEVSGVPEEVIWSRDSSSPDYLSTISVFDSQCARSYVTEENDVAYLPYGLDIVKNLANQVFPAMKDMLNAEIAAIDTNKFPFNHLLGETNVGNKIANLTANSDPKELVGLGTLTEADTNRLEYITTVLNEIDPAAKAKEVQLFANQLKNFGDRLNKPLTSVSNEAIGKLQKLSDDRETAEFSEQEAARTLQSGEELLPGTGNQVWKALFEAARRYSTEIAYPEDEFPATLGDKVCPLCQEALQESGSQRLNRFDEYIKNDVAKAAQEVRDKVNAEKDKLERADLNVGTEETLSDKLSDIDSQLPTMIEAYQSSIDQRRIAMLHCLEIPDWKGIPPLLENPRARIRQIATHQLQNSRTLLQAAKKNRRQELAQELGELSARQNLAKCLEAILKLLQRMKDKATLETCLPSLNTRSISGKSKEFASIAVTSELKTSLDREFKTLGIGHIKTKLKERSAHGEMLHKLLLDLPTANKTEEILSEGEQRAIALGSFLAELSLANHSCGIVFDDPISSLDHWRRHDIARRLVKEAKSRQVIVFTHDTSFRGQLCDEIANAGIPSVEMFLEWQENMPGCVTTGFPWNYKSYKERIDTLEQKQKEIETWWPPYPNEQESDQMRRQYDFLRATIERVTQDVVLNGVLKRDRNWIRINLLEGIVGFNLDECQAIQKLYKRTCDVVPSHDAPSEIVVPVPTATDLKNDIMALKSIVQAIKDRPK